MERMCALVSSPGHTYAPFNMLILKFRASHPGTAVFRMEIGQ